MKNTFDYLIPPIFIVTALLLTGFLLENDVPISFLAAITVFPLVIIAALLERIYPERIEHIPLDQPLLVDLLHYILNHGGGVILGFTIGQYCGKQIVLWLNLSLWPDHWNIFFQLLLILLAAEIISYWQHRLGHTIPILWRFHSLHHKGTRLNLIRAGRFHFIDIGIATFCAVLPMTMVGVPDNVQGWFASVGGILGILQHANIRMRTPLWMSYIYCTPAFHRYHHSIKPSEFNSNYGTVFPLFDIIFGTFKKTKNEWPKRIGIPKDKYPEGFWNQVIHPFKK